ncbi:hypothetical protein LJK87_16990 [Paenibacillus sp. P25]|nr:hypothetical protein LJK87_16990 [Paenibacillus sp. P25]
MYANHVNYVNKEGKVYCCLRNKVVPLDEAQVLGYCAGCPMNRGVELGKRVQCGWNDLRNIKNPHIVRDPYVEYTRMQTRKNDAV